MTTNAPSPARQPWQSPALTRLDPAAAQAGPNPVNPEGFGSGS